MFKKNHVSILIWFVLCLFPLIISAQPAERSKWLQIVSPDSSVATISKRSLQQLGAVQGTQRGLRLILQGSSELTKRASVLWLGKKWNKEVYRVDLSQVVSKYIGETEKNLNSVFADARASTGILFFDEGDALFGKRTPVKDSHDRYANQEVAYLLARLEEYEGIVALATNYRTQVDSSVLRKFKYFIRTD